MTTHTILLVDDDDLLREALAEQFGFEDGFAVLTADAARPGMELARSDPSRWT